MLDAISWGSDGWPTINEGHGPSGGVLPGEAAALQRPIVDEFRQPVLGTEWKWPIDHAPIVHVGDGRLTLEAAVDDAPVFLGRTLMASAGLATVCVDTSGGAKGGLGLIGGAKNELRTDEARNDPQELLHITSNEGGVLLWQTEIRSASSVWLRVASAGNAEATFSYSFDGKRWQTAKRQESALLVCSAWDQGLRVGLVVKACKGHVGEFHAFLA